MSDRGKRYPTPKQPTCPDCGVVIEAGFIPDSWNALASDVSNWVSGQAKDDMWRGLKLSGKLAFPITSFRCGRCGLLREYAFRPSQRLG